MILAGGANHVDGGAGGDYCDSGSTSCEHEDGEEEVGPRDHSKVDVGRMAPEGAAPPALYLDGSEGADRVSASFIEPPSESPRVTFKLLEGSGSTFDATEAVAGECIATATEAVCPVSEAPDSIVLAGLAGEDSFSASGFPPTTSIVELGGEGGDALHGTEAEDVLVDGPGNDTANAGGGDDALPNNQGEDRLFAEAGNDLFISNTVCEGDLLDGGEGRDNANWANFSEPVSLDLAEGSAGRVGAGGAPGCGGDPKTTLHAIEDIEGSNHDDTLIGDGGENQLLGRLGSDSYHAGAGNDSILANSGDSDAVIDCGEGWDTALIDIPTASYEDPAPIGCEDVEERAPNSFRPPGTPPGPNPVAEASTSPLPPDRTPPRTRLYRRPAHVVSSNHRLRRVAFAFSSNEPDSAFLCRLDRRPFRPCASPRRYRVRPGVHRFRVYAVDRAGNADPTPVAYRFRVLPSITFHSNRNHRRRGSTR